MLFATLAATSADVAATRSRLAKRALIAAAIREATVEEPSSASGGQSEIALVVTYLSGSLRQRRTGVGWASLTALPAPAAEPCADRHRCRRGLRGDLRPWAVPVRRPLRSAAVEALFARATEAGATSAARPGVRRDPPGRTGFAGAGRPGGGLRRPGQGGAAGGDAARFDAAAAAVVLAASGLDGLAAVTLAVGQPVRPMLAASAPDVAGAVGKTGLPAVVDTKLDGIRVQVHRNGDAISVYTRSLDDITDRVPEIVAVVARAADRSGSCWTARCSPSVEDGRPLTFQVIASRTMTRLDTDAGRVRRTPLSLFCFDLLQSTTGICWTSRLSERIAVMAAVLPRTAGGPPPDRRHRRRGRRRSSPTRSPTASKGWWSRSSTPRTRPAGGIPAGSS